MSFPLAKDTSRPRLSQSTALRIFLAALLVRWAYALLLYAFMGDDGLKGMDSIAYADQAQSFAQAIGAGTVHGTQWLGVSPYSMPLYQWLTTLPFILAGKAGVIVYVLFQSVLDSGTCVLVYAIAGMLHRRLALPSAIAAILNPTQIVLGGLFYTDTPFTFFIALAFFWAMRWSRLPTLKNSIWLGSAFACAALIRVTVAPWGFCAIGFLAAVAWWRQNLRPQLLNLSIATLILGSSLCVISVRNYDQYSTMALTPQSGDYLTLWVIPLVKEVQDRTPFAESFKDMMERTTKHFGQPSSNPFEQSRRYQQIGQEVLAREISVSSLAASWLSGIFINLASPAHLLSPPVSAIPRTGFYGTPGSSFFEKVFNYAFRSANATYSWLLIVGSLGVFTVRMVQLLGIWALLKQPRHRPAIIFAGSWIAFLLLLNGPIASPKYRLPLEPLFNIMTGAGVLAILDWRTRKFAKIAGDPDAIVPDRQNPLQDLRSNGQ